MQQNKNRSPRGEVEEPGEVAFERRNSGIREQKEREDDRKHRVENDRQNDVENRNPYHGLLSHTGKSVARLRVGSLDGKRVGSIVSEFDLRLPESIDKGLLPEQAIGRLTIAGKTVTDHWQVICKLRACSTKRTFWIKRLRELRHIFVHGSRPLGVHRSPGVRACFCLDLNNRAISDHVLLRAICRRIGTQVSPQICRLAQQFQTFGTKKDIVEDALLDMSVEICPEDRIFDLELFNLLPEPRAIHYPAGRIIERRRHHENRFCLTRKIIPDLARE